MREALDEILQTIGATFLTTEEWIEASDVLNGQSDHVSQYKALRAVLTARGGEDEALERLAHYFRAVGLSPVQLERPETGFSNVFIGAPL